MIVKAIIHYSLCQSAEEYQIINLVIVLLVHVPNPAYFSRESSTNKLTPSIDPSLNDLFTSFVRHGGASSVTVLIISTRIESSWDVLIPNSFVISIFCLCCMLEVA